MPKMKTNKAAKKRFKVSGRKKVLARHAFASHILTKKKRKRKRKLKKVKTLSKADGKMVLKKLPYG